MTYNAGTATDYIDLLDQLIEVVTSRHLDTVAVNAGGTGHVVGDIITITNTGATFTHTAQIEVVTVSGGVITAARIYRGGAYTVDPTTTTGNAQSATTGSGINATFDLTFADTGWTQQRRTQVASAATPAAGGTGYSVSDVLTLVGGVLGQGGSAATFTVATLSGSAVATVTLLSAGQYEVPPGPTGVLTSVAPAGGSGCTLDVTFGDKSGDTVVVLTGDAGGTNTDPVVGIKTYQGVDETSVNTTFNWALFMATANSAVLPIHELPNISPGFNTAAGDGTLTISTSGDGAFVPLKDSDAYNIEWWIRATGRNVSLVAKLSSATTIYYASCSFGLLNPFGISSELAYPACVIGSSDRVKVWYRDTGSLFGGLSDLISRNNGPGFFWGAEGAWTQFRAGLISTNTSLTPTYTSTGSSSPRALMWPLGYGQVITGDDIIWGIAPATGFDNQDFTDGTPVKIYRTPNTGGDLFPLFPLTVVQHDSATGYYRTLGELDGAFWFSDGGVAISSEDRFEQGNARYTMFQSGTRVQPYSFFCLRED